jgi:signal transduction histidine kinase
MSIEEAAAWVAQVFARSDDYPDVEVEGRGTTVMDPDRLQSLLFTLADASMSWGGEGPVRLKVGKDGERPVVEFARRGAEFEPSGVEACFEPPRRGGTGRFGLWLVRRLAGAQGAEVGCERSGGSLFRLTLPPAG